MSGENSSAPGKLSRGERRRLLVAACEIDRAHFAIVWTETSRLRASGGGAVDGGVEDERDGGGGKALVLDLLKIADVDSVLGLALSFLPRKYRVIAFLTRASLELFGERARRR